jgi:hypothetical protein
MYELIKDKIEGDEEYDTSMLENLAQANEIFDLLDEDKRDDYEIIKINRNSAKENQNTLGYDIGIWGNDYSIICDCSLMPEWHLPAWEDVPELANKLVNLNSNMLFSRKNEAEEFLKYYSSKDWAEKGTFYIIRVDACEHP